MGLVRRGLRTLTTRKARKRTSRMQREKGKTTRRRGRGNGSRSRWRQSLTLWPRAPTGNCCGRPRSMNTP
eukprot:3933954-Rhodomonas_salina.1